MTCIHVGLCSALVLVGACAHGSRPEASAESEATARVRDVRTPLAAGARTDRFTLVSESLNEERSIVVRRPAGAEGKALPVLYITDADWQFPLLTEYVEYLTYWNQIPPMLVVGIENVERNRDFVPRQDPRFPHTGAADRFLPFLVDELRAEIERRYSTSGFDVLFGHSFGGVLALHTLFERPNAFDAYIAVGTSTWISDRVLFDEAKRFFDAGAKTEAMVYLSVAEADGGETVPAGDDFAHLWRDRAPDALEWSYRVIPRTNHFTAVMPSLQEAFDRLYRFWGFVDELQTAMEEDGPKAIDATFEAWRAKWGPRFHPQIMELNELAFGLAGAKKIELARALVRRLIEEAPESPEVYAVSSFVEMSAGELDAALPLVRRAIEVGEARAYFPTRIEMYRRMESQIRQAANAQRK